MKQAAKKQLLNAQKVDGAAVVRTTKRTVQVNYTFSRDLDKQDMLRYLKVEHKELIAGFKENVEC